jgi:hypothetical protein
MQLPPLLSRFGFCLITLGVSSVAAYAQTSVVTTPAGFVTLKIPAAHSSTVTSQTAISFPLQELASAPGAIKGRITAVTASTISNSSAGWQTGAFSQPATPFFVRITSGTARGRTLQISTSTPNSNSTLTVNNEGTDLTGLGIQTGASGDTYEIIHGETLSTLFSSFAMSGVSSETADNVIIWTGDTWQRFYLDAVDGRWEPKGINTDASNYVIRPDAGILYERRGASSLSLLVPGRAPTTDLKYMVGNSSSTFVANGFPVARKLVDHNFHSMPGWVANSNYRVADQLMVWSGAVWQRFFFDPVDNRWEPVGVNFNANHFTPPVGRPFMIQKAGAVSGFSVFNHQMPQYN